MPTNIPHIELCTGADPTGTIIWMHGLGADCWDFVPVVKELNLPANTPLRFIFPQAPTRAITVNNGMKMPGWYDISAMEIERKPDEAGVRESQAFIDALIDREILRGIDADKIVLAGFSQGGVIALQTGLRCKHKLAGIMALSTYLALGESLAVEKTLANAGIPILMVHGTQDNVIPIALAHSARSQIEAEGYRIEWHEYPMQHQLCGEEINDISDWITRRIDHRKS